MHRFVIVLLLAIPVVVGAQSRARNVILFLADAGGIPTFHAIRGGTRVRGYLANTDLFSVMMNALGWK